MSTEKNPRSQAKVVVERVYRATLDEVWDLWTTKEGFESWWGPQGFRAEVHEIDARVGGALRYDMIADTPEMIAAMKEMGRPSSHPTSSRFAALVPRERLVLRNVIDFLPGSLPTRPTSPSTSACAATRCTWWSPSTRCTATSSRGCRKRASPASSRSSTSASAEPRAPPERDDPPRGQARPRRVVVDAAP